MADANRNWVIQDYLRGGILFNRADFGDQPYGVIYEAPVILGESAESADG